MTFSTTLTQRLSFRKSRIPESVLLGPSPRPTQTNSFRHSLSFRRSAKPPSTSVLRPAQVRDLTHLLSYPIGTAMLCTNIAARGLPLSRTQHSKVPRCLCDEHTWFEPRFLEELTNLMGEELHTQLGRLRFCPKGLISEGTQKLLRYLEPFCRIFPAPGTSEESVDIECIACQLSLLFQDSEAVSMVTISVKGRKKKGKPWPELAAWLDAAEPGRRGWELRWKREGLSILKDRMKVRAWRKAQSVEELEESIDKVSRDMAAEEDDLDRAILEEESLAEEELRRGADRRESASTFDNRTFLGEWELTEHEMAGRSRTIEGHEEHVSETRVESWVSAYESLFEAGPKSETTLAFEHYNENDSQSCATAFRSLVGKSEYFDEESSQSWASAYQSLIAQCPKSEETHAIEYWRANSARPGSTLTFEQWEEHGPHGLVERGRCM